MAEKKKKKSIKEYYAGMGLDPDKASNAGNWSGGSFNGDAMPSFIKKSVKKAEAVTPTPPPPKKKKGGKP